MLETILQLDFVSKFVLSIFSLSSVFILITFLKKTISIKIQSRSIKKISKLLDDIDNIQELNSKKFLFKNNFVSNLINFYVLDFQNIYKLGLLDQKLDTYFDSLYKKMFRKLDFLLNKESMSIYNISNLAQLTPIFGMLGSILKLFFLFRSFNDLNIYKINISSIELSNAIYPMILGFTFSLLSFLVFNYLRKKFILLEQEAAELVEKIYLKFKIIISSKNDLNMFSNKLVYQEKSREKNYDFIK